MDTFDLNWPKTDATFFTDGWRCRIVWRERRGGMGGTIDNNEQCKRRVADSLLTAPYLLGALRARGHGLLAQEIEALQPDDSQAQRSEQPVTEHTPITFAEQLDGWLAALDGSAEWAVSTVRRAKVWAECGELHDGQLAMKAPAPKGKVEWALRVTHDGAKNEYVAAEALRGLCVYLHSERFFADANDVDGFLAALVSLDHDDAAAAAAAWNAAAADTVH